MRRDLRRLLPNRYRLFLCTIYALRSTLYPLRGIMFASLVMISP